MRVFNANKTEELKEYDLSLGYTKEDKIITRIEAVEGKDEQGHYETIKEYPNGGKDVEWVVDVPKIEAIEEHDEVEDILIYIPYTEEEIKKQKLQKEMANLKQELAKTDYQAIKYAEGWFTDKDYAHIKEQRENLRIQIRELEAQLFN